MFFFIGSCGTCRTGGVNGLFLGHNVNYWKDTFEIHCPLHTWAYFSIGYFPTLLPPERLIELMRWRRRLDRAEYAWLDGYDTDRNEESEPPSQRRRLE